ncbi:MAG: hypothetical protein HC914_06050 [Chloroflexaceae bacterium]|nr:hypothetical protein [Chloroflexaceae bacterium]
MAQDGPTPAVRAQIDLPGTNLNHIAWIEGEEVIKITSDHWVSFLRHLALPAIVAVLSFSIAMMRGLGWQFL